VVGDLIRQIKSTGERAELGRGAIQLGTDKALGMTAFDPAGLF
jgi:hypothetical protein